MPTPAASDLYTVAQVRALEQAALNAPGGSGFKLMHAAAAAALDCLRRHWPQARSIAVCCGPGNNGGDGFLFASLAREAGFEVRVLALADTADGDAALARAAWEQQSSTVSVDERTQLPAADVYVDALFGIGLHRAPDGLAASLIEQLNASTVPVLALDVPSGLDADSGRCPGVVVHAEVTLTFIAAKRGLYTGHAADCVGLLELATLGVNAEPVPAPDAHLLRITGLAPRMRSVNKGDNGHVLVIGGAPGMSGAARLAGEAALRAGAGLVSVATHPQHADTLNIGRPELMVRAVADADALAPLLSRASVLALGPGLGKDPWGVALWHAALAASMPLVLDADGLNLLATQTHRFTQSTVLTPHPGEAARLLGVQTTEVERDRFAAARALAARHDAVVVLKGAGSLIAHPDGRLDVCPWGNPGMASGGMGDLLTGVIAALLAQGCSAWEAACLGVGVHARAGDIAARSGERGLLATDLLSPLRTLLNRAAGEEE